MVTSLLSAFVLFGHAAGWGEGVPLKSPAAVGMSERRLQSVDHVIGRAIRAGGFPGAAVVIGRRSRALSASNLGKNPG